MPEIIIKIAAKKATTQGAPVITCGNSDYKASFIFDDEWSLTGPKTARFVYVRDGVVQHEDVAFSGNVVAVPVMENVAFVDVGVFAGNLCTTTPARVPCRKSILCGSGAPHEPTPDVYDQIMELFENMAEAGGFGATETQARQIEKNKQDITQLASRMDTFTNLEEGSTTGDAELIDARVGYDGRVYASAGEAVRKQVSQVSGRLDEVSVSTDNIFNIDTVYAHTVINKNASGEHIVKASNDWNLSDFIEVEPGTKYEFKAFDGLSLDYRLIVYSYDDTKTPTTDVSYGTSPSTPTSFSSKRTKVFTTSDTCKYVRLQYGAALDNCKELQLTTEANYIGYYIAHNMWVFPNVSEAQEIAEDVLDASIDGIAIDSGYGNENSSGSSNGLNLGDPISTTNLFSVMLNTLKQDGLFNSRIKIGDSFAHDSTVNYYDGSFYITAVANSIDRGDSESSANARTVLYKVTPSGAYTEGDYSQNATVAPIEIAKHGDSIDTYEIENGAGNPNAVLINGVVRSIFLVTINDIRQSCYRDYNCNDGTLGTPRPLTLDGGTFAGWINGCIAYDGSTYYGTMCRKANALHGSVLIKSSDCINWETIRILDEDNAQYEVATAYHSDKLYTATRVLTGLKVRELTPTGEELRTWEINCSNSRPAFFVYHDKLYLAFNGYDRFKMYIAKFTGSNWAIMLESDVHNIYPSFIVVGDEIYLSSTHNSSTSVYLSIVSHSALETTALTNIRKLKGMLEWFKF